jgi:hypothetical protein
MTNPLLTLALLLAVTDGRQINRNEALIGYTERSTEPCEDLDEHCVSWAAQNPSECELWLEPSGMRQHAAFWHVQQAASRLP